MDRTVFITGATGGIGREVAFRFAKANDRLALCFSENPKTAEEIANKCEALGAKRIILIPLDLRDADSIEKGAKKAVDEFGKIDILLNVAGYLSSGLLLDQKAEEIDRLIDINFRGLIKITKALLPYLTQSIVNVASNLGIFGKGKLAVYSATKFAVRGFTKSLAKESPNLKIFAVNPGVTATKMGGGKGVNPAKVADIIFSAATLRYKAPSGADINVRDYLLGEGMRRFVILGRALKHLVKKNS